MNFIFFSVNYENNTNFDWRFFFRLRDRQEGRNHIFYNPLFMSDEEITFWEDMRHDQLMEYIQDAKYESDF